MKKEKYNEKIRKKTGRDIFRHQMLAEGDKVLVGLSGGKDSLALLELLAACRKHIPFPFELYAAHIMATGVDYVVDKDYLTSFCSKINVPLFFETIHVEVAEGSKKHPCFVCSWNRRKKLFEICRKLQCNKLAFGHHMDDAVETFFLNLIYHGSISSLPQKIAFFDGDITIIRPLLYLKEDDLKEYARLNEYPTEIKKCTYDNKSVRHKIKGLLNEIKSIYPKSPINIMRAMDNIYHDYLPKK